MRQKTLIFVSLFIVMIALSCNAQKNKKMTEHKYTNHLINQSSPYLLQHAHNPVDWYPWGEEALEKAKKENKPLIISIGYSACHWCHVMEHESFENEEIAKLMNDNFVCIKVDREERPDIDQLYMNAVEIITGRGGWPLNCFALPDGTPFFGGTYFPKQQWESTLKQLADMWNKNPAKIIQAANQIKSGMLKSELITGKQQIDEFDFDKLKMAIDNEKSKFDNKYGGNKGAPKFPMPTVLNFYMEYFFHTKDKEIEKHLITTLQRMAWGGIYDHIGGGFARYSTDKFWRVPHFEKMLYDNAQLIGLYSNAYKLSKNDLYKNVVIQTVEFVEMELYGGNGVFFSSLDADSDGEEGKFYVWTYDELKKLVPEQLPVLKALFEISANGNWDGKIILHQVNSYSQAAQKLGIDEKSLKKEYEKARQILFEYRDKRIHPGLDDKSITAWNAMMISALCSAHSAFGNEHYISLARETAKHFENDLINDDFSLFRNFKNKKATIDAFLDDYAFTIKAFTELYQTTSDEHYLNIAEKLTEYAIKNFYDKNSGMFFFTKNTKDVHIMQKKELTDGVIPSSNSVMAGNLLKLGIIDYKDEYTALAKQMLANVENYILQYPSYFANWASLELKYTFPVYELAICGPEAAKETKLFSSKYYPNVIYAFSEKPSETGLLQNRFVKGKTLIYVCVNKTCKMPVSSIEEALQEIK